MNYYQKTLYETRGAVVHRKNDLGVSYRTLADAADVSLSQLYRFTNDPSISRGPDSIFYQKLVRINEREPDFWDLSSELYLNEMIYLCDLLRK